MHTLAASKCVVLIGVIMLIYRISLVARLLGTLVFCFALNVANAKLLVREQLPGDLDGSLYGAKSMTRLDGAGEIISRYEYSYAHDRVEKTPYVTGFDYFIPMFGYPIQFAKYMYSREPSRISAVAQIMSDGEVYGGTRYWYGDDGLINRSEEVYQNGRVYYYADYIRNALGKIIRSDEYYIGADSSYLIASNVVRYDDRGRMKGWLQTFPDGSHGVSVVSKYSGHQLKAYEWQYPAGNTIEVWRMDYQ